MNKTNRIFSLPASSAALILACTVLAVSIAGAQPAYHELHQRAIVVDGHNDVLARVLKGESIEVHSSSGHSDIPRFREGGVDVQVFSIWVPTRYSGQGEAFNYACREIDSLDAIVARNPWSIAKVTSGTQLVSAVSRNAIAAIYAVEGCHPAEGSLDNIAALYHKGVRVFGLTWNNSTLWSYSSNDESAGRGKGITAKGRKLITLLDSLGVIIDVSHSGEQSFWDLMELVKSPVIASHSACMALRRHHRNLTDDQLKAIAATGGVTMINFFPGFIVGSLPANAKTRIRQYTDLLDEAKVLLGAHSAKHLSYRDSLILDARRKQLPTILDVADHILHAVQVAGATHVGLGSDFDGIGYAPIGLHSVTELPYLTRELLKRGLSSDDTMNILGGNFARIFSQIAR